MQQKNVDWIGLISGILLIAVIPLSLYNPWWQLRIGDFGYANFSPIKADFNLLGNTFLIPLLTAINVSCLLLLCISAALLIVYSINPTEEYSKQLLCWSYKKPLAIVIAFTIAIVALSLLAPFIGNQFAQIDLTLPIIGTSIIQVPSELLGGLSGIQIGIAISGGFQWTFYLAIGTAVLSIATGILYSKKSLMTKTIVNSTT